MVSELIHANRGRCPDRALAGLPGKAVPAAREPQLGSTTDPCTTLFGDCRVIAYVDSAANLQVVERCLSC